MCIEPAEATGTPGHLAEELGQERARAHPFREGDAVVAVGRDDVVVRPERGDRAHADGLLPDVEVQEAADLSFRVAARALLLHAADEEHLAIELRQVLELRARAQRRGSLRGALYRHGRRVLGRHRHRTASLARMMQPAQDFGAAAPSALLEGISRWRDQTGRREIAGRSLASGAAASPVVAARADDRPPPARQLGSEPRVASEQRSRARGPGEEAAARRVQRWWP